MSLKYEPSSEPLHKYIAAGNVMENVAGVSAIPLRVCKTHVLVCWTRLLVCWKHLPVC